MYKPAAMGNLSYLTQPYQRKPVNAKANFREKHPDIYPI
jgi:hypothetical protein